MRDLRASYVTRFRVRQSPPLIRTLACHPGELLKSVVNDILRLDIVYYRAYWGRGLYHDQDSRVWNPLNQPWMSFVESGRPGEELFSWRAQLPPKPTLEQHLTVLVPT